MGAVGFLVGALISSKVTEKLGLGKTIALASACGFGLLIAPIARSFRRTHNWGGIFHLRLRKSALQHQPSQPEAGHNAEPTSGKNERYHEDNSLGDDTRWFASGRNPQHKVGNRTHAHRRRPHFRRFVSLDSSRAHIQPRKTTRPDRRMNLDGRLNRCRICEIRGNYLPANPRERAYPALHPPGTLASGVYFDQVFGSLSTLTSSAYIIHWQGTAPNVPLPSDTYTIVYHT